LLINSDNNEDILETVTPYSDENNLFEKSKADVSVLLSHLYMLLKRTRKLVNLIHRSSVLDRYVKGQIKIKLQEIKNRYHLFNNRNTNISKI